MERNDMHFRRLALPMLIAAVGSSILLFSQEKPSEERAKQEITPITVGQEMFRAYCASCHGLDGKGMGPAEPALKKRPPDLTQLSKKNGGKFPAVMVANLIRGESFPIAAHGSGDMPIWGNAFRATNRDEAMVTLKVNHLTAYIESIQQR